MTFTTSSGLCCCNSVGIYFGKGYPVYIGPKGYMLSLFASYRILYHMSAPVDESEIVHAAKV